MIPMRQTTRASATHLLQAPAHLAQTQAVVSHPSEDATHDLRFLLHHLETGRSAAHIAADIAVPERSRGQCADQAGPGRVPPSASYPFEQLGALIFCNHALDLKQEVVLCRAADRSIQEYDF